MPMMNYTHVQTLKDSDTRFSKRYLDFICNPHLKTFFYKRANLIQEVWNILNNEGYIEVETPMLNAKAGGALATPFKTHAKELDEDLELWISPELYLKQLLIGGFEKVYELGKVFWNEGIDGTHNPEFTMLEFYQAFGSSGSMKETTEKIIR